MSGADFIATRDQAIAAVNEILLTHPNQFVFIFKPTVEGEGDIGITMFCHGEFVIDCLQALAAGVAEAEPYVAPPPED